MSILNLPELCKKCIHYNSNEKTCSRSIVAVSKSKIFYDYAKAVRNDQERCGIDGKWFSDTKQSSLPKRNTEKTDPYQSPLPNPEKKQ